MDEATNQQFTTGRVLSADGTTIGYRRIGSGPPVILLHGGLQAAQSLSRLAAGLAGSYDVVVPDRRGRGASPVAPGRGEDDAAAREVDDVRALVDATGARAVFGLSAGGLVALRAATVIPELTRLALYEPALSIGGSVPSAWLPRFDRQVAAGHLGAALRTAMTGLQVGPWFMSAPSVVVTPLLALALRLDRPAPGDVPMSGLVRAMHHDMTLVDELADTTPDYADLAADVLLLGGAKSPAYFDVTLTALEGVLPDVRRVTLDGMGHNDADDGGDPDRVAALVGAFFAGDAPSRQP